MEWDWAIDGWIVLVGVLSACSCAVLGVYLVLGRMSLMGDAISHAVLPGLALAFLLTGSRAAWPMFAGAVVVGALTALLTQTIARYGKVEEGAAMGVVFSVLFAIGLVLLRQAADHVDLDPGCVLYGNIVQIALDAFGGMVPPAARNLGIVLGINVVFVALFYKELKICTFDPELATTLGINSSAMHYVLMMLVAVTTVANFEAVGSILVIAILIVPAAAAHLLTDRLGMMIGLALTIAAACAVLGHVTAVFGPGWVGMNATANTSAMMAVMAGALMTAALILSPRYGLLGRAYARLALSARIAGEDIVGLLYRWQEARPRGDQPMPRAHVLAAIGNSLTARWALRTLRKRQEVEARSGEPGVGPALLLTPAGTARGARLVRSHRLWEAYLAKHFALASDHLHMPAERMEHYISPALGDTLTAQLTEPTHDPHGREIPK